MLSENLFLRLAMEGIVLVVDSGSTKTDWIALHQSGERLFFTQTPGLNPEVLGADLIKERLLNNPELYNHRNAVTQLCFYGAGCGTPEMRNFLEDIFSSYFTHARITVKEDTYAAVHATAKPHESAIICILGTGSNCSYWDGQELFQKVTSLGYIIMDDCSGNYFGRQLLRDYYFHKMPDALARAFARAYNLEPSVVKEHLYRQPNPNTYLATFARFLIQHKKEDYSQHLIQKGIQLFIDNAIRQFEQAARVPIHAVGSIAYHLREELQVVFQANGLRVGTVIEKPIEGLVDYHRSILAG